MGTRTDAVDGFILRRVFIPVAHFVEYKTGRTNFFLAAYTLMAGSTGMLVYCAIRQYWWVLPIWVLILTVHGLWWFPAYRKADAAVCRGKQPGIVPLQEHHPAHRLFSVFLTVVFIVINNLAAFDVLQRWYGVVFFIGAVCPAYFVMVPRPPAKPKKEPFWAGWFQTLQPVRVR